jgi:hypothetical protein
MRKLVLELIEPTIKRNLSDHDSMTSFNSNQETLKKKIDDLEAAVNKKFMSTVTYEDFNKRMEDMVNHR